MHTIAAYPIPLNDLSLGARLISEISGRSQEEVLDRLEKEHCSLGFNVLTALKEREVSPFVLSEKLQSFYSDTDAFLYETFVWTAVHSSRTCVKEFLPASDAGSLSMQKFSYSETAWGSTARASHFPDTE